MPGEEHGGKAHTTHANPYVRNTNYIAGGKLTKLTHNKGIRIRSSTCAVFTLLLGKVSELY